MKIAVFVAAVLLAVPAANAVTFGPETSRFDFGSSGNNTNSVSIGTPTVFDSAFLLGAALDRSGNNAVNASTAFNRISSGDGNTGAVVIPAPGPPAITASAAEPGTLALVASGLLGLAAIREVVRAGRAARGREAPIAVLRRVNPTRCVWRRPAD